MWTAWVVCMLSCASRLHAQATPLRVTPNDSAAVFKAVVDRLISDDSASAAQAAADPSHNELTKFPSVFVRIAGMPSGAWATPGIARLRAHQWFYGGRAMDSTLALARSRAVRGLGLRGTPFPAELSLLLEFPTHSDTARVPEYWAWNDCEEHRGLLGILFSRYLMARASDGWHLAESQGGGTIDALCR